VSVNTLKEPFVTLNLDIKPSKVKLKKSDNININIVGELNNTMLNVFVESDNATV
jgi:hypothetical protein